MANKITTGRFETREELEEYIRWLYHNTECNQSQISKNCRVSEGTVANILK